MVSAPLHCLCVSVLEKLLEKQNNYMCANASVTKLVFASWRTASAPAVRQSASGGMLLARSRCAVVRLSVNCAEASNSTTNQTIGDSGGSRGAHNVGQIGALRNLELSSLLARCNRAIATNRARNYVRVRRAEERAARLEV